MTDKTGLLVEIVSPVYNEETGVFRFIEAVGKAMETVMREHHNIQGCLVSLIDDGSLDATWEQINCACQTANMPRIMVRGIRLSRNFGKEKALACGLYHSKGDLVITMDSDLQHPPEEIPAMIERLFFEGADVVNGVKQCRASESPINRIAAKLFYAIMSRLTGMDMRGASDFKVLRRHVIEAWKEMPERSLFSVA